MSFVSNILWENIVSVRSVGVYVVGIDLTNLDDEDGWRKLTNKFKSKCCICGEKITDGTDVLWKKGTGIRHIENCHDVEQVTTTEDLVIIDQEEWDDFERYSMDVLRKMRNCQCCGKTLDATKDTFINAEKRTCERCFMK